MEEVVEHIEILDMKKVATIKGLQRAKIVARLHLERVMKLQCSFKEEKVRNEDLIRLLGWASETFTRLEQKR